MCEEMPEYAFLPTAFTVYGFGLCVFLTFVFLQAFRYTSLRQYWFLILHLGIGVVDICTDIVYTLTTRFATKRLLYIQIGALFAMGVPYLWLIPPLIRTGETTTPLFAWVRPTFLYMARWFWQGAYACDVCYCFSMSYYPEIPENPLTCCKQLLNDEELTFVYTQYDRMLFKDDDGNPETYSSLAKFLWNWGVRLISCVIGTGLFITGFFLACMGWFLHYILCIFGFIIGYVLFEFRILGFEVGIDTVGNKRINAETKKEVQENMLGVSESFGTVNVILLSEVIFEDIPQFVIQVINTSRTDNSWSLFVIISLALSGYFILQVGFFYLDQLIIKRNTLRDIVLHQKREKQDDVRRVNDESV